MNKESERIHMLLSVLITVMLSVNATPLAQVIFLVLAMVNLIIYFIKKPKEVEE